MIGNLIWDYDDYEISSGAGIYESKNLQWHEPLGPPSITKCEQ